MCRLDNTHETQKKKLSFVFEYAYTNDCIILQAGDFFDIPRSWRLLPVYIDFFKYWVGEKKLKIYGVFGQHDVYMYNQATNDRTLLGALAKIGLVEILSSEPVVEGDVSIYGTSYGQKIPKPVKGEFNILVIHAPILMGKLWSKQEGYYYAPAFLEKNKFDLILCGDIHQKFMFRKDDGRIICNTGCIVRKSVTEWDHTPGFYTYDTDSKEAKWVTIPHEPPEKVMSREHLDMVEQKNEMMEKFISSIKSREVGEGVSFKEILRQVIEKNRIESPVQKAIAEVMEEK